MKGLTEKQVAVLAYIRERVAADGYPPTIREIGGHMGIGGPNGVLGHLRALEKKGQIELAPGSARAIRLPGVGPRKPSCPPARMLYLTPAQSRLYRYLASCSTPPTLREMCGHMGWSSMNAVAEQLGNLERKGLIRRKAGRARAITVV